MIPKKPNMLIQETNKLNIVIGKKKKKTSQLCSKSPYIELHLLFHQGFKPQVIKIPHSDAMETKQQNTTNLPLTTFNHPIFSFTLSPITQAAPNTAD